MMIDHIYAHTLPAAYALLPKSWDSPEATAMLLAIGLQESRFQFRRQIHGPARSFWQFELGGVRGVLRHDASREAIMDAIRALQYAPEQDGPLLLAIEHNDTLAACFARALLRTVPGSLPGPNGAERGWHQYIEGWRPGRPKYETWTGYFALAWGAVLSGRTVPPILNA